MGHRERIRLAARILSSVASVLTALIFGIVFACIVAEIRNSGVRFPHRTPFVSSLSISIVLFIIFLVMIIGSWVKPYQLRITVVVFLIVLSAVWIFVVIIFLGKPDFISQTVQLLWTSDTFDGGQRAFELRKQCCGWDKIEDRCSSLSAVTCKSAFQKLSDSVKWKICGVGIGAAAIGLSSVVLTIIDLILGRTKEGIANIPPDSPEEEEEDLSPPPPPSYTQFLVVEPVLVEAINTSSEDDGCDSDSDTSSKKKKKSSTSKRKAKPLKIEDGSDDEVKPKRKGRRRSK
jgi:hypothetical protein